MLILGALFAVVGLALGHVRFVFAHANYVRSIPAAEANLQAAPTQVQVWFSEAAQVDASELQVLDSRGARMDNGDTRGDPQDAASLLVSLKPLSPGVYFVSWQTASAVDGHRTRGSFPFSVGVAAPTVGFAPLVRQVEQATTALQSPPALETFARASVLMALTLLAGGFAFNLFVLRSQALVGLRESSSSLRRKALWTSLIFAALAFVFAFVVRATQSSAASTLNSRFGGMLLVRLALLGLLAVLLWRRRDSSWPAIAVCACLLLTQSLVSHSAAEPQWILPTLADWVHLSSAAIWLGGVAMLAFVVVPTVMPGREWRDLGEAIKRFSPIAMACVLVLALTGVMQSAAFVGSVEALLSTSYGRALLSKIALFVALIGIGAFHQFVISPHLNAWRAKAEAQEVVARRFRMSISAEVAVSALVLIAAGAMTALPPARDANLGPDVQRAMVQTQLANDLTLTLGTVTSWPRLSQLALRVTDASGQPVEGIEKAVLRASHTAMDMGVSEIPLETYGSGNFVAQTNQLSMLGDWQVEAIVRRAGMPDARAKFTISVN
jgi:copper transport protein